MHTTPLERFLHTPSSVLSVTSSMHLAPAFRSLLFFAAIVMSAVVIGMSSAQGQEAQEPGEPNAPSAGGELDAARTLFFEAHKALKAQDYARAEVLFEKADTVYHAPTTLLGLARARAGTGKLALAYETYDRILKGGLAANAPPAFVKAVADAQTESAALEPRLSAIVVTLRGAKNAVVAIDGAVLERDALGHHRYVDPGTHQVVAAAKGFQDTKVTVTVAPRERKTVALTLRPAPSPAPRARREPGPDRSTEKAVGVALTGLGVAALVVAAVTGGLYLEKKAIAEEHCTADKRCEPEGLDATKAAKTLGIVNTVAWPVAAAAFGVGAYFLIVGFSPGADETAARLTVGGGF